MADSLRCEVEDFYYAEAELLDNRQFREWFTLLADDIRGRALLDADTA